MRYAGIGNAPIPSISEVQPRKHQHRRHKLSRGHGPFPERQRLEAFDEIDIAAEIKA